MASHWPSAIGDPATPRVGGRWSAGQPQGCRSLDRPDLRIRAPRGLPDPPIRRPGVGHWPALGGSIFGQGSARGLARGSSPLGVAGSANLGIPGGQSPGPVPPEGGPARPGGVRPGRYLIILQFGTPGPGLQVYFDYADPGGLWIFSSPRGPGPAGGGPPRGPRDPPLPGPAARGRRKSLIFELPRGTPPPRASGQGGSKIGDFRAPPSPRFGRLLEPPWVVASHRGYELSGRDRGAAPNGPSDPPLTHPSPSTGSSRLQKMPTVGRPGDPLPRRVVDLVC